MRSVRKSFQTNQFLIFRSLSKSKTEIRGLFENTQEIKIRGHHAKERINHKPIRNVKFGKLQLIDTMEEFISQEALSERSDFLWNLKSYYEGLGMMNPAKVRTNFIYQFLCDLTTLNKDIASHLTANFDETLITGNASNSIIFESNGRPLLLVLLSSSSLEKSDENYVRNLRYRKDLGQAFDFMMELRSYHGHYEVFCVISSMTRWRFCWLPDSEALAGSSLMKEHYKDENKDELFNADVCLAKSRRIVISDIFPFGKTDLPLTILSLLAKCLNREYKRVHFIDFKRVYVTLLKTSWKWRMLRKERFDKCKESINLLYPRGVGLGFNIIQDLEGGADGKVVLALSNSLNLIVIKQFFRKVDFERESKLWFNLYQRKLIYIESYTDRKSLVLPFVFPCIEDERGIYFDFDLCSDIDADSLQFFNLWREKISNFVREKNYQPFEVALSAIKDMANRGYLQSDLEWRHFALMPIIGKKSEILEMRPIMIDLSRVKRCRSSLALEKMLEAFSKLKSNGVQQLSNKYPN